MKTALFTNFSNEDFIGHWDGKGKKFTPGQTMYMPDYLAAHFAKHLVNRELLRKKADGNPVYPNGEKFVSPKRPQDVPIYMELFNKAYTEDEDLDELGEKKDDIDTLINVANKNRNKATEEAKPVAEAKQDPNGPQIILPPEDDEDDSEESFGGSPVEIEVDTNPQTTTEPAPNTN